MRIDRVKMRHRAIVWGMFVTPAARGKGVGAALLRAAVDHARAWPGVLQVQLAVTEAAVHAQRMYVRAGFREWGVEPRALQWEGRHVDEHHMVLASRLTLTSRRGPPSASGVGPRPIGPLCRARRTRDGGAQRTRFAAARGLSHGRRWAAARFANCTTRAASSRRRFGAVESEVAKASRTEPGGGLAGPHRRSGSPSAPGSVRASARTRQTRESPGPRNGAGAPGLGVPAARAPTPGPTSTRRRCPRAPRRRRAGTACSRA